MSRAHKAFACAALALLPLAASADMILWLEDSKPDPKVVEQVHALADHYGERLLVRYAKPGTANESAYYATDGNGSSEKIQSLLATVGSEKGIPIRQYGLNLLVSPDSALLKRAPSKAMPASMSKPAFVLQDPPAAAATRPAPQAASAAAAAAGAPQTAASHGAASAASFAAGAPRQAEAPQTAPSQAPAQAASDAPQGHGSEPSAPQTQGPAPLDPSIIPKAEILRN